MLSASSSIAKPTNSRESYLETKRGKKKRKRKRKRERGREREGEGGRGRGREREGREGEGGREGGEGKPWCTCSFSICLFFCLINV